MHITFLSPIDGDVLNRYDGREEGGSLFVPIRISAPAEYSVFVNGVPCAYADGVYTAEIRLDGYRNTVAAVAEKDGERAESSIALYRFKNAFMKYRLAIDDIIWSVEELAKGDYSSVFAHPFFAIFKRLHDDFGTKTQLNLYYETVDGSFNLSMMPDRYKAEFEEASDWLKLTFHARQDKPDRIYRFAPYEELYEDYKKVTKEIVRFAGENAVKTAVNGLHWAETTREGARALRSVGVRCLVGYYIFDENGDPHVAYYLNHDETVHASGRDFWVDTSEDIIFSKDKIVIDAHSLDEIASCLDEVKARPHEAGTINLVTHEQYFFEHYENYMPDYEKKIRTAVQWAHDNGYTPAFLDEAIAEEMPTAFL